jgi:hypothetical protein
LSPIIAFLAAWPVWGAGAATAAALLFFLILVAACCGTLSLAEIRDRIILRGARSKGDDDETDRNQKRHDSAEITPAAFARIKRRMEASQPTPIHGNPRVVQGLRRLG